MTLGGVMLLAAVLLAGYNLYEDGRAENTSEAAEQELLDIVDDMEPAHTDSELPEYVLHPEMEMPVSWLDEIPYVGFLTIPEYNLNLPVIDTWNYSWLKLAPCRYSGSAYQNNLVLAGHNYRSHFGRLRHLVPGDQVIFSDMDGNQFVYQVAAQEILGAYAVEEMKTGDWDLTLFTCTYGGQMRRAIRCYLVE